MRSVRQLLVALPLAALLLEAGSSIGAQELPPAAASSTARDDQWAAPLDRKVVLHLLDASLREALDRVAAAARFRISYSAELLPLDRPVRVSFDSVAAGDVIVALLRGIALAPVVAGPDQIVLAPVKSPPSERIAPAEPPTALTLDRVVVTGSANGGSLRPLTVALDVVNGGQLYASSTANLARVLDYAAPGMWAWEQSPASLLARYGSIRGASSFGASYPKIYIDGIEVANPLLITQLAPESIERVEVIRGPQGAALYGADAISGVVNIVMRHEGVEAGMPRVRASSSGGFSESAYVPQAVFSQNHALGLAMGSSARSAQLDLGIGALGAFYPGASSQDFHATGGVRLIGSRTIVTGTARLLVERVGASVNPLLADSEPPPPGGWGASNLNGAAAPQSLTEYTVGATMKLMGSEHWTHTLVAGVDGYRLANVANDLTPFPSSTDSALRAARGSADRTTLRASSVVHFGDASRTSASLMFAAEHSALRAETVATTVAYTGGGRGGRPDDAPAPATPSVTWLSNAGVITQADVAFGNALFFTGGVRIERNDGYVGAARYSTLPMIGSAWVRDVGDVTVKLRAAWGKGIRAPKTAARETVLGDMRSPQSAAVALAPEEQSGVEGGVDLFVGRALSVQVTRFDQLASGLIQQVAVADSASATPGASPSRLALQYQNVGAINNRGWELQATAHRGPLALIAALATVESRVNRLATGYSGDLRPGDRILDVPARTASLSAAWSLARWSGSAGVSRAFDWIDYDRLALAKAYVRFDRRSVPLVGADLRGYWRQYDGITHLRASVSRAFGRGLTFVVTGENLLDNQRGEPDNATILPGRTVTTGLRASFF